MLDGFDHTRSSFCRARLAGRQAERIVIENHLMKFYVSQLGMPEWAVLAVSAVSFLSAVPANAQSNEKTLSPIIVSGSRFASSSIPSTPGATVITDEQIRRAGVSNVSEAIRKIGGVYARANTTGSPDFDLDLRGFGTNSSQNVVVLVDGIRLSENEQVSALLSSVPVESVERIEIVRGGNSVLYGEGATGGTIQIFTKRGRSNQFQGSAFVEAGSFDHKNVRVSAAKGWDGFSIDANIDTLRTDNYRKNNELQQDNFNGGLQWASDAGRIGLRVDVARQESEFAGDLSLEQFKDDPRQASTPNNFGSYDTDRYTFFVERRLGGLDVAAEISHREKRAKGHLDFGGGFASDSDADSNTLQFSPRVRHLYRSGNWANELVGGFDFIDWERSTTRTGFTDYRADVEQQSKAVYLKNEVSFDKTRLAVGVRNERFEKDAKGANVYHTAETLNAWEVQGTQGFGEYIDLYAKTGTSYRLPNADDNAGTLNNAVLKPQRSRDIELGASYAAEGKKLIARLFRHKLTDEILFDPTVPGLFFNGANVNLDPTRRQGIELEGAVSITPTLNISAVLQHVSAKFTQGPNKGREMVLVPKNTATLRAHWLPVAGHSADLGIQWVDSQRYGGDFTNTCDAKIPSFTTVDGRYAIRTGAWEFAITGINLTDRDYFTNAFGECRTGIYPDSGRQIKISARMDF